MFVRGNLVSISTLYLAGATWLDLNVLLESYIISQALHCRMDTSSTALLFPDGLNPL